MLRLAEVDAGRLAELVTDAWRMRAPDALAGQPDGPGVREDQPGILGRQLPGMIVSGPATGGLLAGYRGLAAAVQAVCTMAEMGFPGSELVAITTGIVPARMAKKTCRPAEPSKMSPSLPR